MQNNLELLRALVTSGFQFVVVGGVAAVAHGSAYLTVDLDVAAPFSAENLERLVSALRAHHPRFATAPHVPFPTEPSSLAGYKNLYVRTDLGKLDVLGESPPTPPYAALMPNAVRLDVGGVTCSVISVSDLIATKKAVGRPKDLLVAAELEAIRARETGHADQRLGLL